MKIYRWYAEAINMSGITAAPNDATKEDMRAEIDNYIVNTFNAVNGDLVKYVLTDRRPGDVATCYASPKLAEEELGFKAEKTLDEMCKSGYQYQKNNKK